MPGPYIDIEEVECCHCYAHHKPGIFARRIAERAIKDNAFRLNLSCKCPKCARITYHQMHISKVSERFYIVRNDYKKEREA